jgi:aminopeptidase N
MTVLLSILVLAAALQSPSTVPTGPPETCSHAKTARARLLDRADDLRAKSSSDPLAAQTDVLHYRLDFEVDPAARYLTGSNAMTVKAVVDGVTHFRFWLHDALAVTAVEVDGRAAEWQRLDAEVIEVSLGRNHLRGETFTLEVGYEGAPVSQGWMSIVFETHDGSPVVSTLSEPWFAYTWWPVKEDNRDKATGELLITVPDELTVVSNGTLVDVDTLGGGRRRFHWSTGYPTSPYLFAFSAARYSTFGDTYVHSRGSMPVDFFIYPSSDTSWNRGNLSLTVDMLDTFGELYGPYPFLQEKYAIYEFPWGGGMEHQTATGQGGFWESLTAHELAHQWWGDMVTCTTWSDIWLNEGFATYSEALWLEHKPGTPDPASALRTAMNARRPSRFEDTVYVYDTSSVARIFSSDYSYRKGAWVLHMLRWVVGDEAFFEVLEAYRDRYAYRTATTHDFRRVAEDVAGADLRWFFDQWVFRGGAPDYRYGWRESVVDGQRYLELSIEQNQTGWVFEMPVTVETLEHGRRRRYSVWNDERSEQFLIPVSAPVDDVEIDPDDWILTRSKKEVAFAKGAPRLVALEPEPGATVGARTPLTVNVTFDEDVVIDGSCFMLRRAAGSEVALGLSYDAASFTATLVTQEPPGYGRFELIIADEIVGAATGLALDGELGAALAGSLLPSGDGEAGGDAVVEYVAAGTRRSSSRVRPADSKIRP